MLFLHLFLSCFYISDYPGVYVGQNIAMGHTSFRVAISQWYFSEVDMYTYGGAYVHGMGHYYQVLTSKDILELSGTRVPPPRPTHTTTTTTITTTTHQLQKQQPFSH